MIDFWQRGIYPCLQRPLQDAAAKKQAQVSVVSITWSFIFANHCEIKLPRRRHQCQSTAGSNFCQTIDAFQCSTLRYRFCSTPLWSKKFAGRAGYMHQSALSESRGLGFRINFQRDSISVLKANLAKRLLRQDSCRCLYRWNIHSLSQALVCLCEMTELWCTRPTVSDEWHSCAFVGVTRIINLSKNLFIFFRPECKRTPDKHHADGKRTPETYLRLSMLLFIEAGYKLATFHHMQRK